MCFSYHMPETIQQCSHHGITSPAGAGKTRGKLRQPSLLKDHPRWRGKDCHYRAQRCLDVGSPPLTRERRKKRICISLMIRITPAHAGKTAFLLLILLPCRDHPRSRGKDGMYKDSRGYWTGSPPLTRERPSANFSLVTAPGITPAHAGKTSSRAFHTLLIGDHPRSRGKD